MGLIGAFAPQGRTFHAVCKNWLPFQSEGIAPSFSGRAVDVRRDSGPIELLWIDGVNPEATLLAYGGHDAVSENAVRRGQLHGD
jgi:hypothetical protein